MKDFRESPCIPPKSKSLYEIQYNKLKNWCFQMKIENVDEQVLLGYFQHLAKIFMPTTLWSTFSEIKAMLMLKENIDIIHCEWVEISVQQKLPNNKQSINSDRVKGSEPVSTTFLNVTNSKLYNTKQNKYLFNEHGNNENNPLGVEQDINTESSPNNFLAVFLNAQRDLLKNPHSKITNKLTILLNLKEKLTIQIQNAVEKLWPSNKNNNAREYKDDSYLDFPSNETSLLTIGFLTFAVFLIKMVLKVIHALKYKNQNYSYNSSNLFTTSFGRRKRFIREVENEDFIRIMESIQTDFY